MVKVIDIKARQLEKLALENGAELKVVGLLRTFNDVPVYLVEMEGFEFAGYVHNLDLYMVDNSFITVLSAEEQEAALYHEEGHRVRGYVVNQSFEEYVADEIAADSYAVSKGYGTILADTLIKSFAHQFGSLDNLDEYQRRMLDERVAVLRREG